jgi:hypothetical protein
MKLITLAFLDSGIKIFFLTNPSGRFYAGFMTQTDDEQLSFPMEEKFHQPQARFCAQQRRTVTEKEGFAVVHTVTKVDCLLLIY